VAVSVHDATPVTGEAVVHHVRGRNFQDLHVTVVNAATGEILRDLLIDPRRDYQPTGRPPGPAKK
jgi:hypothetical protein